MVGVGIGPNRSTRVEASRQELAPEVLVGNVVLFTTRALVTRVPCGNHVDHALGDAARVAGRSKDPVFLD
jgi:hypothetical protein